MPVVRVRTLAFAQIARTTARLGLVSAPWIGDAAVIVWIAAMLWLPMLVLGELRRPRLGYDLRRWSMVFPLGMYAVCSFTLASVRSWPAVEDFARAWTWVALAGWLVVAAGGVSSRSGRSGRARSRARRGVAATSPRVRGPRPCS